MEPRLNARRMVVIFKKNKGQDLAPSPVVNCCFIERPAFNHKNMITLVFVDVASQANEMFQKFTAYTREDYYR